MNNIRRGGKRLKNRIVYKVAHLFCGIGGGSLGFTSAEEEHRGVTGQFKSLVGIDADEQICKDYERITGSRAACVDLFSREQYIKFHGQPPPPDWEEVTPSALREIIGDIPDVVFTSPPCKGFSGLLGQQKAETEKYQALNELTVRSFELTLKAYADDLPALILLENVPRITTRGKALLDAIKQQLTMYGYVVSDNYHDCGPIGGLAQHRKRYLLIARNPDKLDSFVYEPPEQPMKTIGDVLKTLPSPVDSHKFGKIHSLPRLQFKTWVRLALISAGGDWRDLNEVAWERYCLTYQPRQGAFGVAEWEKPMSTVTGAAYPGRSNSVSALADPRTNFKSGTHTTIYRVMKWDDVSRTVTGAHRPNNGALSVADPRISGSAYVIMRREEAAEGTGLPLPDDSDSGVFTIVSLDGTWHRPLTTLELAQLQGFPLQLADGQAFELTGADDARWRERIGNAVPVQAAAAIAQTMLRSLLANSAGEWLMSGEAIWVIDETEDDYDGQSEGH